MILHPSLQSILTWLELTTTGHQDAGAQRRQPPATKVTYKEKPTRNTPPLSEIEQHLKWRSYHQLQQLLKSQRFPRAIGLVEGLAQRLPHDPEVRQWQASAYQRWGSHLLNTKQLDKARIYLKKALKTDPHNRSLWLEVERDFSRMEKIFLLVRSTAAAPYL